MKIVIVGANGQVGAEVCLKLAGIPGVELVPVSRTRMGSAFLRSRGVAVWHGDASRPDDARAMFDGATVIANFALAAGVGKAVKQINATLIDSMIDHSAAETKLILFSTLAVHGEWDGSGKSKKGSYADLKLFKERHFSNRLGQRLGWTFRLGHVCGHEQNLSSALFDEILSGSVHLPDPDRPSNVTLVDAICEAIMAVADGRADTTGRYDLVNAPQWSWREIYQLHGAWIGVKPHLVQASSSGTKPKGATLKQIGFGLVRKLGLRRRLERLLPLVSVDAADKIRADFMVNRASEEIAALTTAQPVMNSASFWPEVADRTIPWVRPTRDIIDGDIYVIDDNQKTWPKDLDVNQGR